MRISVFRVIVAVVYLASFAVAEDFGDEPEAIAKIKQLGGQLIDGGPRGITVSQEPIPSVVIPFWALVVPLTLISIWLLLSRPHHPTQHKTAIPVDDEGRAAT